jgi:histidinol-phosphatase
MQNSAFLKSAIKVIDEINALIMEYYNKGFESEEKSDTTLVTEADFAAEKHLRSFVEKNYPQHGVIGEEFPNSNPNSEFQWIIDPIDGTQNFAHHIPTFGTILSLYHNGKPLVGVIDHPALNLRYHSSVGEGVFCNGKKIHIKDSNLPLQKNEVIGLATRGMFARTKQENVFDELVKFHESHRIYYDVYSTSLAISGSLAVMIEYNCTIWDISCTELMINEAGGMYVTTDTVPRENLPPRISAVYGRPAAVKQVVAFIESKKL